MNSPDIILTIPNVILSEFLGTVILDILHDSKGRGCILPGKKLYTVIELLFYQYNTSVKDFLFMKAFEFFKSFWFDNLKALGDISSNDVNILKETVLLPMRNVNGNMLVDEFIYLGKNRKSVEYENYLRQKKKLKNTITFSSPTDNFFTKLIETVEKVKGKNQKVCLDMKGNAGLLRSITDPIGYITNLAVYADPGYSMAGMSAIRKNSDISFTSQTSFRYIIELELQNNLFIPFIDTNYYYGKSDVLARENLCIVINDEYLHNSLPKSSLMCNYFKKYLNNEKIHETITTLELLQEIQSSIDIKCYKKKCTSKTINENFVFEVKQLYSQFNFVSDKTDLDTLIVTILPDLLLNKDVILGIHLFKLVHEYSTFLHKKIDKRLGKHGKMKNYCEKKYNEYLNEIKNSFTIQESLINKIVNKNIPRLSNYNKIFKKYSKLVYPYLFEYTNEPEIQLFLLIDLIILTKNVPNTAIHKEQDIITDTFTNVIGKFCGDFGQIMWCIHNKQIFASEDNNASAMACLLQTITKDWTSIHGIGDGGSVDIHKF